MTNQSRGKNGLSLVTLNENSVQTVQVQNEDNKTDDNKPRIIDSQKIEVETQEPQPRCAQNQCTTGLKI